jgi:hypothetical protein
MKVFRSDEIMFSLSILVHITLLEYISMRTNKTSRKGFFSTVKRWKKIVLAVEQRIIKSFFFLKYQSDIVDVTCNSIDEINQSDKRRGVRVCTVRYNVYSNSSFSKFLASLICVYFYIRVQVVKLDRTEQNEQYLIGRSIMTPDEWYISLDTIK